MVSPVATKPPGGFAKVGSEKKGSSHQGPLTLPAREHVQTQVDVSERSP